MYFAKYDKEGLIALRITLPNHIWQNTLPANFRNEFSHKIKRDGITILHGIHDEKLNH